METSVKTPPQPDKDSASRVPEAAEGEAAAAVCTSSSTPNAFDAMEVFGRRLDDIIRAHGSALGLPDKPTEDKKELRGDAADKGAMQKKMAALLEERQQLQAEQRSSVAARCKLETLCRELQAHYNALREETLQRCREEEEKRSEITSHFQSMLTEIQTQIEQHSARNDKLCSENANLTDKLESLMNQCDLREESLEKINKRRDLQQKLTEAKLQQANVLLSEAEEKHKREKEYLLREAIEKTKKCFAMKEQELAMKKKLTLYAQKFDEFQETLAKSNEIYVRFKKEMDNMSEKMKQVEKESNVWKTRFENCNKALTDMIEERSEKGKEYELFVLKIQKLEKLCRALQEERKGLYEKIKEVRLSNANIPARLLARAQEGVDPQEGAALSGEDTAALLTSSEMEEIQQDDPVLTEDMSRLRDEQAKLREFAASLFATPFDREEEEGEEVDLEEDLVASAFAQFSSKSQARQDEEAASSDVPPPEGAEPGEPTPDVPAAGSSQKPDEHQTHVEVKESPRDESGVETQQEPKPAPEPAPTQQEPKPAPEPAPTQQEPKPAPEPAPEPHKAVATPPTKAETAEDAGEAKPAEDTKTQQTEEETPKALAPPTESTPEPKATEDEKTQQQQTEAPPKDLAPPTDNTPEVKPKENKTQQQQTEDTPKALAPPTDTTPAKKQAPKKKKKRNGKSAS